MKRLRLTYNRGYENKAADIWFCRRAFEQYFDVSEEACELHASSSQPRDDDYYQFVAAMQDDMPIWRFADSEDAFGSPWCWEFDEWLNKHFKRNHPVYVWLVT